MVSFLCHVLVYVCLWPLCSSLVQWEILTYPVVLHKDVVLRCKAIATVEISSEFIWQWIGGPTGEVMCQDRSEYCSNATKYSKMVNYSGFIFDLKIADFQMTDINAYYTCSYGFSTDSHKLEWNNQTFISLPADKSVINNSSLGDKVILFNVKLESVYPVPICNFIYTPLTLEKDVNVTAELIDRGPLYTVSITGSLELSTTTCSGDIELNCTFMPVTVKIWSKSIDVCHMFNDDIYGQDHLVLTIITCVVLLLNCAVCTIIILKKRNKKSHRNDPVDILLKNSSGKRQQKSKIKRPVPFKRNY